MKRLRAQRQRQQTPEEVLDALLGLISRKWYEGDAVSFAKDRQRLLQWVVLWPARHFFNAKGVAVPAERYRELMNRILLDAAAFQAGRLKYRPAWLMEVVQSHFRIHGDEIYEEAKSIRSLAENALLTLGKLQREDALVPSFTTASRLLDKRQKTTPKPVRKDQLTLL